MRGMNSERLYFVGGKGDLATFTWTVVSKKKRGSLKQSTTKRTLRGTATPGHTALKKIICLRNKNPLRGNANPARATLGAEPKLCYPSRFLVDVCSVCGSFVLDLGALLDHFGYSGNHV